MVTVGNSKNRKSVVTLLLGVLEDLDTITTLTTLFLGYTYIYTYIQVCAWGKPEKILRMYIYIYFTVVNVVVVYGTLHSAFKKGYYTFSRTSVVKCSTYPANPLPEPILWLQSRKPRISHAFWPSTPLVPKMGAKLTYKNWYK